MDNRRRKLFKFLYFLFVWKFVNASDVSLPFRNLEDLHCIMHESQFTCDCGNKNRDFVLKPLSGTVNQISVQNCQSLVVESTLLMDTYSLRKLIFKNVDHLVLEENSLEFPKSASTLPLYVNFENTNIEKIHALAISGNIEEVTFTGGSIGTIRQFGFTTTQRTIALLRFESVWLDRIEPQAFKRFSVQQLHFSNCFMTSPLPSKSFYEITVEQSFTMSNMTFLKVFSRAFNFKDVNKLHILNSKFAHTEAEWITAYVKENVIIRDNKFGVTSAHAFAAIDVQKNYVGSEKLELRFINNTVQMGTVHPLIFSQRFHTSLQYLQYDNAFPCHMLEDRQPKEPQFKYNQDTIFFKTVGRNQSLSVAKIINVDCPERSYLVYIIVGVITGLVVLGAIIGIIACEVSKRRKLRKHIIMPEPRTYTETQIVYKIENAGLLKTDL